MNTIRTLLALADLNILYEIGHIWLIIKIAIVVNDLNDFHDIVEDEFEREFRVPFPQSEGHGAAADTQAHQHAHLNCSDRLAGRV